MPPDRRFLEAVSSLFVPRMGTELVAPLLYDLVRMLRPRRALEVGMGYTTPFVALALSETRAEAAAEAVALDAKSAPYLRASRPLDDDWLAADPALVAPAFHRTAHEPRLAVVDDFRVADSSAPRALDLLRSLGLDDVVTVVEGSLRDARERIDASLLPIDFAWVDAWECLYFFDRYWDLIEPDGGVVAFHYLLTYPEGEAVVEYVKSTQRLHPDDLEVVSLLEPHKLRQNSVTLVRKTSGYRPGTTTDESLRADAAAVAERITAERHRKP